MREPPHAAAGQVEHEVVPRRVLRLRVKRPSGGRPRGGAEVDRETPVDVGVARQHEFRPYTRLVADGVDLSAMVGELSCVPSKESGG